MCFILFQLSRLEAMIQGVDESSKKMRSTIRKCLCTLSPKTSTSEQSTINKTARAVFRLIAPDEVFQYYTREATTKSTKKPLASIHPRLNQLVTTGSDVKVMLTKILTSTPINLFCSVVTCC